MKTLHEIITMAYHATGKRGRPTAAFIRQFRAAHPVYRAAPLGARFVSGSVIPNRPMTRLDRATDAWRAAGNPMPGSEAFDADAFNTFVEKFRDEYDAAS